MKKARFAGYEFRDDRDAAMFTVVQWLKEEEITERSAIRQALTLLFAPEAALGAGLPKERVLGEVASARLAISRYLTALDRIELLLTGAVSQPTQAIAQTIAPVIASSNGHADSSDDFDFASVEDNF